LSHSILLIGRDTVTDVAFLFFAGTNRFKKEYSNLAGRVGLTFGKITGLKGVT